MRWEFVKVLLLVAWLCVSGDSRSQDVDLGNHARLIKLSPSQSPGYAAGEINSTSITRSSLVTDLAHKQQFAAYYDGQSRSVVLARRSLGLSEWQITTTHLKANAIDDAHDAISIGIDGRGHLHMAWGIHSQQFRYVCSESPVTGNRPFAPQFGPVHANLPGQTTNLHSFGKTTYPEFYNVPGSDDLLCIYRFGSSGSGDHYLSRYDAATSQWRSLVPNELPLISRVGTPGFHGGSDVNAYTNNMVFDSRGNLFLTWNWRTGGDTTRPELSGFQTNHDLMFAMSRAGEELGNVWRRQDGAEYQLPITQAPTGPSAAQIIRSIPENSTLINQAGMAIDRQDRPMLATWWAPGHVEGSPKSDDTRQYILVYFDGQSWQASQITNRPSEPIVDDVRKVSEMGQPVVMVDKDDRVLVVLRYDRAHRGDGGITVAHSKDRRHWEFIDLSTTPLGDAEPTFDWNLWQSENKLAILHQPVGPVWNGEQPVVSKASPVSVLEWDEATFFRAPPAPKQQ